MKVPHGSRDLDCKPSREIGRCEDKLQIKQLMDHSGEHVLSIEHAECPGVVLTKFASVVVLSPIFFFLLTRFAPLILVGLLYALVDRRLSRNKVSRCCQLQQKQNDVEEPDRVDDSEMTKTGHQAQAQRHEVTGAEAQSRKESPDQSSGGGRMKLKVKQKAQAKARSGQTGRIGI